jgi:hypothetical protein
MILLIDRLGTLKGENLLDKLPAGYFGKRRGD